MVIHPKTSAAGLGGALGLLIVGIVDSISGVTLAPELSAAIPAFLSTLAAFIAPSRQAPASKEPQPAPAASPLVRPGDG